jgi:DNA polymerase V
MNFYQIATKGNALKLKLYSTPVSAGFPSPADDYSERQIDLNEHLIKHPAASFFVRVQGESMINAGIHDGDLLIVDRALEPRSGSIVVAVIDGEFTVKRVELRDNLLYLMPENEEFAPIEVNELSDFQVWGVVAHVIHSV